MNIFSCFQCVLLMLHVHTYVRMLAIFSKEKFSTIVWAAIVCVGVCGCVSVCACMHVHAHVYIRTCTELISLNMFCCTYVSTHIDT